MRTKIKALIASLLVLIAIVSCTLRPAVETTPTNPSHFLWMPLYSELEMDSTDRRRR